jgi:hypothetical protein
MDPDEFFGEVISVYTDADALSDGTLIDIAALGLSFRDLPINRMTCGLWAEFLRFCGIQRDSIEPEMDLQTLKRTMQVKLTLARLSGGIWTLPPKLWLIENEVGGWTVMRPEDY